MNLTYSVLSYTHLGNKCFKDKLRTFLIFLMRYFWHRIWTIPPNSLQAALASRSSVSISQRHKGSGISYDINMSYVSI